MEIFIFKFGRDEFHCKAADASTAKLKADMFVDRERPMEEPYRWVPSAEGEHIFRMTVGA